MFDLWKFLQPAYLFDVRPFTSTQTIKLMMAAFGLLIVIGLALKIYRQTSKLEKFQNKLLDKCASYFAVLGLLGAALTWLRYERVQLLSSRYWLIGWFLLALAWLYPIIRYRIKVVPHAQKQSEEKKQFQKYLPGKK